MQIYKRLAWIIIIAIFVWLVASKRLTMAKLRKWKAMAKMAFQVMRQ